MKKIVVTVEIESQIDSELLAAFMDAIREYKKVIKERGRREQDYVGIGGLFLVEEIEGRAEALEIVAQELRQRLGIAEDER